MLCERPHKFELSKDEGARRKKKEEDAVVDRDTSSSDDESDPEKHFVLFVESDQEFDVTVVNTALLVKSNTTGDDREKVKFMVDK